MTHDHYAEPAKIGNVAKRMLMNCKVFIFDDLKNDLNALKVEKQGNKVFVTVKNKLNRSRCPSCHKLSRAVHSYYSRKVLDLPILGTEC